ncbi:LysR family transcriptional regulator (plasmid) [Pseudomonas sp. App30]|uniref:LysR family transcriptional regulator n=1 Tax=Pseudomonas sp. App30 TaxID=3068990 RepID=UPI003A7FF04A
MELRHFRYFLAVARFGSFSLAASQLGIAPPTLTRQIQDMEAQLGARLFARQARKVSLTQAGEVLQVQAALAVRQFEQAQQHARQAARGETGSIEIGYVASAVYSGVLQHQLQGFTELYPEVLLNVRERPMASLPEQVAQGRLDIGIVRAPLALPDGVESINLPPEGFVLALPDHSPLCRFATVSGAQLVQATFILPEQINGTLQLAAQAGFAPRLGPQPGSLVAVLALVSLGQGVAVVPESLVGRVALPGVVYRPFKDTTAISWLAVLHRRFERAAAVQHYIEYVSAKAV